MTYTTLYNCACWHLHWSERAHSERDRERHAALADRLFVLAYMVR